MARGNGRPTAEQTARAGVVLALNHVVDAAEELQLAVDAKVPSKADAEKLAKEIAAFDRALAKYAREVRKAAKK